MSETKSQSMVAAVGRRKSASARIRMQLGGSGVITVNGKPLKEYFSTELLQQAVNAPLALLGREKEFDISAKVVGGGLIGQSEAVRHGITRALIILNPENKPPLRAAGYVTRDPREKERMKPGLKKARRAPQWNKR